MIFVWMVATFMTLFTRWLSKMLGIPRIVWATVALWNTGVMVIDLWLWPEWLMAGVMTPESQLFPILIPFLIWAEDAWDEAVWRMRQLVYSLRRR